MSKEKKFHIKKTDKATLEKWFKLMVIGRALDDRAPNYLKQAIGWSYHAPYAGHDGIQLAIGQVFDKENDHLFPYYRDMLTALSAGVSTEEIILNGISKATDVAGGGRHMSNHFAKPEWNIHNSSSCTGNHAQHATGAGRAIKQYKVSGVSISSQGESSVSEGYVYEAINGASNEKLPVIFVFQDNGYGISVPKKDQTATRKVADNFSGFKYLKIYHCNGKDVFDSMNTMFEAKEYVEKHEHPVIVQANCVRMHSHSNSDRHDLYRDDYELNYVSEYDPLAKYRRMLLRYERFTEEELVAIEEEAKAEVKKAHKAAMSAPDPDPASIFDYVLPEPYVSEKYPDGLHCRRLYRWYSKWDEQVQ
jgi:2-oxoisovalerate dehydrogenase E1 component